MSKRKRPASSRLIQFWNCYLLRDHKIIRDDLWVRDGIILDPHILFFEENVAADIKLDCKGLLIAPGYIDVQINGGFGVDFSSDVNNIGDGIKKVSNGLLQHGVTSFCPTIVTSRREIYHQVVPEIRRTANTWNHGAIVLGIHLEGPFISKEKRGAHKESLIEDLHNNCVENLIDYYGSLDFVKIVTLAPEKPFALEAIKFLTSMGIIVSIGHTMSSLDVAENAAKCGATFITHLFNAMLPFHHRDPGVVGLLTSYDIPQQIFYGLIADGIHTHPTALRIAHRSHYQGLVLVSDAIAALGLPPGKHCLGTVQVEIDDKMATVSGSKTLAGSIAPLDFCVRQFLKLSGCSKVEAIEAASLHPAQLLKLSHKKGTLNYEGDADVIFLNDQLEIQATFIAGSLVWSNEDCLIKEELLKYKHMNNQ